MENGSLSIWSPNHCMEQMSAFPSPWPLRLLSQRFPVNNPARANAPRQSVCVITRYFSPDRVGHVNSGTALTHPAITMTVESAAPLFASDAIAQCRRS